MRTRETTRSMAVTCGFALACSSCLYPPIPEPYVPDDVMDANLADGADAGPLASVPVLNSCRPENYVDRTDESAQRTIGFGGANTSGTFGYSPRCLLVAAGQTVQFRGEFASHPLSPGVGVRDTTAGSPNNPIPPTSSGMQIDVRFDTPGTYPFFCMLHVSTGMAGVVTVR